MGIFVDHFPAETSFSINGEHSRFPEVEIIRSTSTPVTIERLEKIFSVHGFPVEFVSENGPPF